LLKYINLFIFVFSDQKGDDELAIQIMYLLYQLMCHPITGDYIIQNTGIQNTVQFIMCNNIFLKYLKGYTYTLHLIIKEFNYNISSKI